MTRYEFIFSNKPSHRLSRHLLFWLLFALHTCLFRYYINDLKYLSDVGFYMIRLQNLLLFLPVSVFYAYFAIYFLLPEYILKARYGQLIFIVCIMALLLVLVSYLIAIFVNVRLAFDLPFARQNIVRKMDFTFSNGLVYPLTVSGFAIGIKMSKKFYLQQKENELLAAQRIAADVLLSKSQVHPRFLFHSLSNLYKQMLAGYEQSAGMLLKLSELLSYILYEADEKAVPLEKELLLLQNYIDLEKVGWGQHLHFLLVNNCIGQPLMVAPLLLLPVAEYVFEEADKTRTPLSIELAIDKVEDECRFIFTVSGAARPQKDSYLQHIQLVQVQKRLEALYPKRHQYKVVTGEAMISISISIQTQN